MISARRIFIRHNSMTMLDGVSVDVRSGECVSVSGAPRSGRTSLLRVIAGMVKPTAGTIHLNDEDRPTDVFRLRRAVTYAATDAMAGHGLRVDEYLRFVAQVRAPRISSKVLTETEIATLAGLDPSTPIALLTPPKRAALALAAALATPASVVLIDESMDVLPSSERERLTSWLVETRDRGVAMLVATNDADVQKALCHRILRLVEGRVAEQWQPISATPDSRASYTGEATRSR